MERYINRTVFTSKFPQGTGLNTLEEFNASYEVFRLTEEEFVFMEKSGLIKYGTYLDFEY